jgi:hypothetical protein
MMIVFQIKTQNLMEFYKLLEIHIYSKMINT